MSNLKHSGMTKAPLLLELNNCSRDTSSDEVRKYILDNFLMESNTFGPDCVGIMFMDEKIGKKYGVASILFFFFWKNL